MNSSVLPNGALVDELTQSRLGDDALGEVLANLWGGDCQTCGRTLGSELPALLIDDLGFYTRASLHHSACQAPAWNDSMMIKTSSSALVTWRSVVLVLPFQVGGGEILVAALLVNPSLEEVRLMCEGGVWHPRLDDAFLSGGLTYPAAGIPIRKPLPAVSGRVTRTSLSALINGRTETYETSADPEIRAHADELNGFLLIVTHAAHPGHLDSSGLEAAMTSRVTLVGWAELEPNSSV